MFRASATSRPIVCSAAETTFDSGAFATTIPRRVAASTSTLSTPTPARPITLRCSACAINSAVTLVAERTISASYAPMISSSGDSVSTSTSNFARSSSTPASAICSRTRTFTSSAPAPAKPGPALLAAPSSLRRLNRRVERLKRTRHGRPSFDPGAQLGQRQLDGGKRTRNVENVEPADMADPEDLALERALPRRERHAVAVAQVLEQLGGVDPVGHAHSGHHGGGVVVG